MITFILKKSYLKLLYVIFAIIFSCLFLLHSFQIFAQDLSAEDAGNTTTKINKDYKPPTPDKLYSKDQPSLLKTSNKIMTGISYTLGRIPNIEKRGAGLASQYSWFLDYAFISSTHLGFSIGIESTTSFLNYGASSVTFPFNFGFKPGILYIPSNNIMFGFYFGLGTAKASEFKSETDGVVFKSDMDDDFGSYYKKIESRIIISLNKQLSFFSGYNYQVYEFSFSAEGSLKVDYDKNKSSDEIKEDVDRIKVDLKSKDIKINIHGIFAGLIFEFNL